jgi:hypothetical protein
MTDLHVFEPLGRKSKRLRSAPERRIVRSRPDARSKLVGTPFPATRKARLSERGSAAFCELIPVALCRRGVVCNSLE